MELKKFGISGALLEPAHCCLESSCLGECGGGGDPFNHLSACKATTAGLLLATLIAPYTLPRLLMTD